jgi:hypothetical protein
MCCRHVHILPRIKAYSILLFPLLTARVRGGNNGEICRVSVSAHTSGPEGRALHAAKLEVIVSGKKAVAAMTCPGDLAQRR